MCILEGMAKVIAVSAWHASVGDHHLEAFLWGCVQGGIMTAGAAAPKKARGLGSSARKAGGCFKRWTCKAAGRLCGCTCAPRVKVFSCRSLEPPAAAARMAVLSFAVPSGLHDKCVFKHRICYPERKGCHP